MASAAAALTGDRSDYLLGTSWSLTALAGTFLGLRLYCKVFRHRGLWWDDYFLVASWVLLLLGVVMGTRNVQLGLGRHFAAVNPANLERLGLQSILSGFFTILSALCSKTSFAITLLRLTEGWLRRLIWFLIASINVLMPLSALFLFVNCSPVERNWKPAVPGTCWPARVTVVFGIVVAAYSAACDLALALLPWRILMRFHMYRREKIGVALAMSMGVFACATVIVKAVLLPSFASDDFTYKGIPFVIWGITEAAVTIMAASVPALRALVNEIRGAPQFIQRMVPSLRISPTQVPPSKRPDDGPGSSHAGSPPPGLAMKDGGLPAAEAAAETAKASSSNVSNASTLPAAAGRGSRKFDERSDKSILARSGLSTVEAGEVPGDNDMEMNAPRRSYQMQDVCRYDDGR